MRFAPCLLGLLMVACSTAAPETPATRLAEPSGLQLVVVEAFGLE